jgi:hypothetical protein
LKPAAQVSAHVPAVQVWPEAQTLPQAPQLTLSVRKSAQVPTPPSFLSQALNPGAQLVAHLPALQASPEKQGALQAPQF